MPLPVPKPNEDKDSFINRFMSNPQVKKEFPDLEQRIAVAFETWRRSKKKK